MKTDLELLMGIVKSTKGTIFLRNYVGDSTQLKAFCQTLLDQVVHPLEEERRLYEN